MTVDVLREYWSPVEYRLVRLLPVKKCQEDQHRRRDDLFPSNYGLVSVKVTVTVKSRGCYSNKQSENYASTTSTFTVSRIFDLLWRYSLSVGYITV